MTDLDLPRPVREFVGALNRFDLAGLMATFADDAFVNDNRREFWGKPAIEAFSARELIAPRVTMEPTKVVHHHDSTFVRGKFDGNYPKDNLPDPLFLDLYFTVKDDKIVTLFVINNKTSN
jgi:hypothetical protein